MPVNEDKRIDLNIKAQAEELRGLIKEGMADMEKGYTRPFADVMADLKAKRKEQGIVHVVRFLYGRRDWISILRAEETNSEI